MSPMLLRCQFRHKNGKIPIHTEDLISSGMEIAGFSQMTAVFLRGSSSAEYQSQFRYAKLAIFLVQKESFFGCALKPENSLVSRITRLREVVQSS